MQLLNKLTIEVYPDQELEPNTPDTEKKNPDEKKEDENQEAKAKTIGAKITQNMSPGTKQQILEERAERKRLNSRRWHSEFSSKGVP